MKRKNIPTSPNQNEAFFKEIGINLGRAQELYSNLDENEGVKAINKIQTNFTGTSMEYLDKIDAHAAWQVNAAKSIYGICYRKKI